MRTATVNDKNRCHESGSSTGELLTVSQAAKIKKVSARSLYRAIGENRLPCVHVLGKLGLRQADVMAYEPIAYRDRPGAKARGGRPKGTPQTPETKARISASQAKRWERVKAEVVA